MRLTLPLFFSLFISVSVAAQVTIIPEPASIKYNKGSFRLSTSTVLLVRNGVDNHTADFWNNYLKKHYGLTLKKVKAATSNYIEFSTLQTFVPGKEGAYTLQSSPKAVVIQGQTASGTFYGMQTLIQLLPTRKRTSYEIPALKIDDEPRFDYRGMHLDVCRHFHPVSYVKKYIDYLALHKLNRFHWHLTDDQGWRIPIKKYPELTTTGANRNGTIIGRYPGKGNDNQPYGGAYTIDEIKEVVKYAKERFIEVIPEIEMPGHGSAAIAAYPWLSCFPEKPTEIPANMISEKSVAEQKAGRIKLVQETWGVFDDVFCAGKDSTFMFLQDVIDEIIPLFPSKYIHIGGDECPKTHWKICPSCQQRMNDLHLKDEHELQSYFIQRMEKYINGKGKSIIGWDEILEGGLAPNATVMSWRGVEGGIEAAKQKHAAIMTPGHPMYFDHTQSEQEDSVTIGGFNPIEKVYAYEPVAPELEGEGEQYILGAQANLWAEYIKNSSKIEYMIFPRMAALSEMVWSKKEKRNWENFEKKLQEQFRRYDFWKVNYSKAYFDLKSSYHPSDSGVIWRVTNRFTSSTTRFDELKKLPAPVTERVAVYDKNDRTKILRYDTVTLETQPIREIGVTRDNPTEILIKRSGLYRVTTVPLEFKSGMHEPQPNHDNLRTVTQQFYLNKATGKTITLTFPASPRWPGDGPFTLINGIQNEKGLTRGKEFLGFEGKNCDALIDLGEPQEISSVTVHFFEQRSSWIWQPKSLEVHTTENVQYYTLHGNTSDVKKEANGNGTITLTFDPVRTRYVKIIVENYGAIPEGEAGAGNNAWLFVDEIEVK